MGTNSTRDLHLVYVCRNILCVLKVLFWFVHLFQTRGFMLMWCSKNASSSLSFLPLSPLLYSNTSFSVHIVPSSCG